MPSKTERFRPITRVFFIISDELVNYYFYYLFSVDKYNVVSFRFRIRDNDDGFRDKKKQKYVVLAAREELKMEKKNRIGSFGSAPQNDSSGGSLDRR